VELLASWQRTGRSPWGRVNQYKILCLNLSFPLLEHLSFLLSLVQLIVLTVWLIVSSVNISKRFWNCYFFLIINWICFWQFKSAYCFIYSLFNLFNVWKQVFLKQVLFLVLSLIWNVLLWELSSLCCWYCSSDCFWVVLKYISIQ